MGLILQPAEYSGVALRPLVQDILDRVWLCSMSSVNEDGTAHVNTAFFCVDAQWCMYFVSGRNAKHSQNVAARPSVGIGVYDSRQAWDDWKAGVQLFGACSAVHGRDARVASNLYKERFPAYGRWLHTIGLAIGHRNAPAFFRFVPHSVKLLCEESLGEEVFVSVGLSRDWKHIFSHLVSRGRSPPGKWFLGPESSRARLPSGADGTAGRWERLAERWGAGPAGRSVRCALRCGSKGRRRAKGFGALSSAQHELV